MKTSARNHKPKGELPAKPAYHHGDLRNALIQSGIALLAELGPERISLRELAKRAGVSHNAPYQHFPDREALLAAIAEEGYALLLQGMRAAAGTPQDGHLNAAAAYVRFAIAHPHHFRALFLPYDSARFESMHASALAVFDDLRVRIEAAQRAGSVRAGDARKLAFAIWAHVHGIAEIINMRRSSISGFNSAEELIDASLEVLVSGLRPQQS